MTRKEYCKKNAFGDKKTRCDSRAVAESTLKAIALLCCLIAILSQWALAYYAEDYYAHSHEQKSLSFKSLKIEGPSCKTKKS